MYNLKRNDYCQNPKNSTIYTPPAVSQFIYELLKDKIPWDSLIFDPCAGEGNLLRPWANRPIHGMDIAVKGSFNNQIQDFLTWDGQFNNALRPKNMLFLCNPPFNGYGKKLGSEVWLDKIIELFGKEVPIVLFFPTGLKYDKLECGKYPSISSVITKHKFLGVGSDYEILIFNIQGLKDHYFLPRNLKDYE